MPDPRVLFWDIESSPALGYVWQKYQTDVLSFETDWYLLSIAWSWLGEDKVSVKGLCDFDRYASEPENDIELAALAHRLFCEADIVVAHNGIAFDTRKAQARMIYHGFDPPTPFKEVDTLKIARRHFAFTSNRLGDVCNFLGIGTKLETGGFQTWHGCLKGDERAWAKMKKYNRNDVVILEKLYLKLLPWMVRHPNMASLADRPEACPKCGVEGTMQARGDYITALSRRKRFQCTGCGGWSSGRAIERTDTQYV